MSKLNNEYSGSKHSRVSSWSSDRQQFYKQDRKINRRKNKWMNEWNDWKRNEIKNGTLVYIKREISVR